MNIFTFTKLGRTLLLSAAVLVAALVGTASAQKGTLTDSRDGQKYRTVKMPDGKTWMAQNLNYATTSGSWCYDNDPNNCNTYGRLYDWKTAKTACPKGWHLPTQDEWNGLRKAVRRDGNALKSVAGWKKEEEIEGVKDATVGTDKYGFAAMPGGQWYADGKFSDVYEYGFWWTATGLERSSDACFRYMRYDGDGVFDDDDGDLMMWEETGYKTKGYSVRCVQN